MNKIEFPAKQIPDYVYTIAEKLIQNSFQAFLVGGAVRDLILERNVRDYDISTNATPEEVNDLFPKCIATGAKFGNTIVVVLDKNGESHDVDVTTFRRDEKYFKGRWPSIVEYTQDIKDDLSRRDFTINALAINLQEIIQDKDKMIPIDKIIDPFQGIEDILSRNIKAVGNPNTRLQEDGLRSYRACRLAAELNFQVDPETKKAIFNNLNVAKQISAERIRDELNKMMMRSPKPSVGFTLMDETGLLGLIIPELVEAKKIVQPQWHSHNLFEHSLKCIDIAGDKIKIAALFHDIGKLKTQTQDEKGIHYYSHDKVGAEMTEDILKRLRYNNHEIARIKNLVRWHMFYYPSAEWREDEQDSKKTQHGWTDAAIRRFINRVGEENIEDLFKLRIADAAANEKSEFDQRELDILEKRIAILRQKEMAINISDLAINGDDLTKIGIEPGTIYTTILNDILNIVIDNPNTNTYNNLINYVQNKYIDYINK
jgi:tRNA nucleotidyltransferase (CCA-adding enzyme)